MGITCRSIEARNAYRLSRALLPRGVKSFLRNSVQRVGFIGQGMVVVHSDKVWSSLFKKVEVALLEGGSESLSLQIVEGNLRVSCPAMNIQPPAIRKLLGVLKGEYILRMTRGRVGRRISEAGADFAVWHVFSKGVDCLGVGQECIVIRLVKPLGILHPGGCMAVMKLCRELKFCSFKETPILTDRRIACIA